MTEQKKEKLKKIAYVVSGRSLLTKIGCANAGAKVTPSMLGGNTLESQLTTWYKQIRDGVLELPKSLKTELKKAAKENKQISLEDFFQAADDEASGEASGEGSEVDPEVDPEGDPEVDPEGDKKKPSRPRGAKRK